ncbi:MAG: polymerase alpha subunit [Pseudomonadota bacterium]
MSPATINEPLITLPAPEKVENLIADYQHLGYTLGEHPISMLRACLSAMRFTTASAVRSSADRALARAAGLVICRQRPGTASGVMFITLEDETGSTNVIVHPALVEKQRREVLRARLLGVYGQVQRDGEVVHLIAKRLVDHSDLLATLATRSRDFH